MRSRLWALLTKLQAFQCDLRRAADVERLVRHVAEKMKDVKYQVNVAGVFSPKSFQSGGSALPRT